MSRAFGLLIATALLAAVGTASAAEEADAVLVDTSPRLTAGDALHIEQNVQFALATWLTERDREILLEGLLGEWFVCDRDGRGELLEFAAGSAGLASLEPQLEAELREATLRALHGAAESGRPLGRAVDRIRARVEGRLREAGPTVRLHDGDGWLETQEWALSLVCGSRVRIPEELGARLLEAAADARGGEIVGAAERWARLRAGSSAAPAAALGAVRTALAKPAAPPRAEPGTFYAHPLGLYALMLPQGYQPLDGAGGNAEGQTFAGPAGRVLAVGLGPVPPDVAAGNRPLASVLEQTLKAGGAFTEPLPRSVARPLGASALIERGGKTVVLCMLRAPGDTSLVTIAGIAPPAAMADFLPELALALESFAFVGRVWEGQSDWPAAAALARPGEGAISAGERQTRRALEEVLGLSAVRVFGAPVGKERAPVEAILEGLDAPDALTLLDCPRAAAPGGV